LNSIAVEYCRRKNTINVMAEDITKVNVSVLRQQTEELDVGCEAVIGQGRVSRSRWCMLFGDSDNGNDVDVTP
jgi:hypothetical protein